MEQTIKLHTLRNITLATFFGGPLAAGILIRQNYINLDKQREGLFALLTGLFFTVLIFVFLLQIPDNVVTRVPSALIPFIYTSLISFIVEKIQGNELRKHKQENGAFYSPWKATGIGFVCLVVLLGGIFGYYYMGLNDWDIEKYNTDLKKYGENEEVAMTLFNLLDNGSKQEIIYFIDSTGIPKWKENVALIQEMDAIENLPAEFAKQDCLLLEYCKLRIEAYGLMATAVEENSSGYDSIIISIHNRINEIIEELE